MKLLITGSCGFIFSNFIRKSIYENAYHIASIDKIQYKVLNSLYLNKNHTFYLTDILDASNLDMIFSIEKPDIVIHASAYTLYNNSLSNSIEYTKNIIQTQNVLQACINNKVNRIIYISSDSVYGELKNESDKKFDETSDINPLSLYATSKASSELLVKSYNKKYNIDYNIVRLSNIYGPRQYPNKLIPKTIKSILNKKDVEVYGQGNKIRDWTYINDLYLALKKVIEGEVNKTYNISSGNEISNIEIIQKICNIMNDGHNLIKNTHDRDDEFRRSSSNEEIKKIGWEPSIKFSIGLEETVNWYLSNQYFLKEKI